MGGSLRLGANEINVKPDTIANKIYGQDKISKRHRHRYEVNNGYVDKLIQAGLVVSARTPKENLCEIIELHSSDHPWFFGCQFHPEFTSNPKDSHPLFTSFINAAIKFNQKGL